MNLISLPCVYVYIVTQQVYKHVTIKNKKIFSTSYCVLLCLQSGIILCFGYRIPTKIPLRFVCQKLRTLQSHIVPHHFRSYSHVALSLRMVTSFYPTFMTRTSDEATCPNIIRENYYTSLVWRCFVIKKMISVAFFVTYHTIQSH